MDINLWWHALSPELQGAWIGAAGTALSAAVAASLVILQIRSSAKQARDATSLQHQQAIRIELYREVADRVARVHELEGDLLVTGHGVLDRLRDQPWAIPVQGPVAEMEQFRELHRKAYNITGGLAELLIAFERWEIAEPRLSLFHAAMNSAAHNIRTTANDLWGAALAVGDVRIQEARKVQPEGELMSLPPFNEEQLGALQFGVEQLLRATGEAGGYVHDTRIELQNLLLHDIFQHKVPTRKPLDPTIVPLSLDRADELQGYFEERSPWGQENARIEARTKAEIAARSRGRDGEVSNGKQDR